MGRVKEFSIVLSRANNAVYHPGSSVEGKVVLELSAPQSLRNISISMAGKARVKFTKGVWIASAEFSESQTVLAETSRRLWRNDTDSQQIEAGRHEFSFSFQLPPTGLPTSYERENPNSDRKGYIRYSLNATLERLWKPKCHVSATFNVKDITHPSC